MPTSLSPARRVVIDVPGEMRGKGRPRFARIGAFVRTYTDARTANAETWVRSCAIDAGVSVPIDGPLSVLISITVAIPRSWPKRKQAAAQRGEIRPTGKPDLDNSIKLIADALNGVAWPDDSAIVSLTAAKGYGMHPSTRIVIERIAPEAA